MIRADEFSKDLCRRLNETVNSYQWEKDGRPNINWKPAPGVRESVDLVGEPKGPKGRPRILIEIELRRDDPSANVIKVWKWRRDGRIGNFVLIQAFSRFFTRRSPRLLERAKFVGERMAQDKAGDYIPIKFKYNPRKHGRVGAGRRRHHARFLAGTIVRRLREKGIFGK